MSRKHNHPLSMSIIVRAGYRSKITNIYPAFIKVLDGHARLSLLDFSELSTLDSIQVSPKERGKGLATNAMKRITDAADRLDIAMTLMVIPQEKDIDPRRLIEFFKRFGFTVIPGFGDGYLQPMIRDNVSLRRPEAK
jgi:GNAT superfamily N-acetyltransferase